MFRSCTTVVAIPTVLDVREEGLDVVPDAVVEGLVHVAAVAGPRVHGPLDWSGNNCPRKT